jgi:pyruvate/2-oxoglutarate dehydrogenase complex dihydrolipoamide acyltransferase (E2) component
MGEPITLKKGKDTLTVFGRHEAAKQVAKGWALGGDSQDLPLPNIPIDATDGAKELAEDSGVDLAKVTGTGQNGRITKLDVVSYLDDNTSPD